MRGAGRATPARRASDKPMAMACFVERAPYFPLRMLRMVWRTNSPACVDGDLPSRASRWARARAFCSGMVFFPFWWPMRKAIGADGGGCPTLVLAWELRHRAEGELRDRSNCGSRRGDDYHERPPSRSGPGVGGPRHAVAGHSVQIKQRRRNGPRPVIPDIVTGGLPSCHRGLGSGEMTAPRTNA